MHFHRVVGAASLGFVFACIAVLTVLLGAAGLRMLFAWLGDELALLVLVAVSAGALGYFLKWTE